MWLPEHQIIVHHLDFDYDGSGGDDYDDDGDGIIIPLGLVIDNNHLDN